MPDYEQSYLGQLRQLVGKRKIMVVSVRAVIANTAGDILLVRRSDNQEWVLPAGSMELDESVYEACVREVREETGLEVEAATLIAVYSDPRWSIVTAYGDPYQLISFVFRVDRWSGTLLTTTDETIDARFFPVDALPEINAMYQQTLDDFHIFAGTVLLR